MGGITAVSDTLYDKADGQFITVYSSPLYYQEEIKGVLFATYSTSWYEKALSTSTFGGSGYSYVVKSDGTCLVESGPSERLKTLDNLFDVLEQEGSASPSAIAALKKDLLAGKSGSINYRLQEMKYLYYQPLDINDWYLLTIVPARVIQKDLNGALMLSYIFTLLCVVLFILLLFQLIKVREISRKALERIAFVDQLTQGPTYEKFKLDALKLIDSSHDSFYLVFMNLMRFRDINAQYGFEEGDRALRHVYGILTQNIKETELAARQTADNFLLLLREPDDESAAARITRISACLTAQKDFQGKYYELKPVFGIYEIKTPEPVDYMVDQAKLALNSIKYDVFCFYAFYNDQLKQELNRIKTLENRFERAVHDHEFIVWYQPKYSIKKERFDGSEALIRWNFPNFGLVSPAEFIPIFERNGSILELDVYVFETVCAQIRAWLDQGLPVQPVSINLSRLHLHQTDFIKRYLDLMESYRIPSRYIQLELTETALFENKEVMIDLLNQLRSHGIKILMDDFGSGYSSVLMLKDAPIDILKLDKGLIDDLESNNKGWAIIKNMIHLSHELGILVVAEGVETKAQFELLKELDCDYIQGYYFSRPMGGGEYEKCCLK